MGSHTEKIITNVVVLSVRQQEKTMSDQEILDTLRSIVAEIAGLDESAIELDKSFVDDLDIDSLSMVEIAMEMDSKLGVGIPDEELKNIKTVGDAVNFVKANS
jgi:acyl carrier protein